MADANAPKGINEILAELCAILERQQVALDALTAEVEGLKATLTGYERQYFDQTKRQYAEAPHPESSPALGSIRAIVERLRDR